MTVVELDLCIKGQFALRLKCQGDQSTARLKGKVVEEGDEIRESTKRATMEKQEQRRPARLPHGAQPAPGNVPFPHIFTHPQTLGAPASVSRAHNN